MPTETNTLSTQAISDKMVKLRDEKFAANELQQRKHTHWNDNYELMRGKVRTNRLTQRQAVNIPLMKETIKTSLSKVDEAPMVDWQELGGDEEKELIYQEVWNDAYKTDQLEIKDTLGKKNVLIYGLDTKFLNITDKGVSITVLDPYDIVFDPLRDPNDVETARFFVIQNIFRSVREILADEKYSEEGKNSLRTWADSPAGITQSGENKEQFEKKMERMRAMNVESKDFALFAGGDRIINMSQHFTQFWDEKKKKFVRHVVTYAEDFIELRDVTLKEAIGVEFWPIDTWAEDIETQDQYPDSVADLVRDINKVINVWFSQLIENRTLKNFRMHWFTPSQSYTPQTYTPGPGVMLPAPPGDDIRKVIMPVDVDGLDDTLSAISALTQIVERGSGATAIDKGQSQGGSQTLGEVELLVGKAMERASSMSKFYRQHWYRVAYKWDKMLHANAPKFMTLYKASQSGKLYPKRIYAADWVSETGYEPVIRSSSEQEAESLKGVQKWKLVLSMFPANPVLRRIAQKRTLEIVDLTPEELKQVEEAEKQAQKMQEQTMMQGGAPPGQEAAPVEAQVASQMQELESLNA